MRKLLTIAFFSVFCLGAKALETAPTNIYTWNAHNMDVTLMNGKKVTFENECMQFNACNGSQDKS